MATKKTEAKEKMVDCITVRKIGLPNGETSEENQEVSIPVEMAKKLQDVGAIKVKI